MPRARRSRAAQVANRGIKRLLQPCFFPSRAKHVLRPRLHDPGSGLIKGPRREKTRRGPGGQGAAGLLACNAVRAKQLTNFRSQGSGVATGLTPAAKFSLERAIEYIAADEFVEVTPKNLRLRKRILNSGARIKATKQGKN